MRGSTVPPVCLHAELRNAETMFDDLQPETLQLLAELDRLAEEQRLADGRDPHALVECERKLNELRQRIERLQKRQGDRSRTKRWASDAS